MLKMFMPHNGVNIIGKINYQKKITVLIRNCKDARRWRNYTIGGARVLFCSLLEEHTCAVTMLLQMLQRVCRSSNGVWMEGSVVAADSATWAKNISSLAVWEC